MKSPASIHDVARLAQVSVSTVSNVLNDRHERMRPDTRERVLHAVEELGYKPRSHVARQLKSAGHVRNIGLVIPAVDNPFWGMVTRNVEDAAQTYGYQVLLCNGERNPLRERQYAESLWASGVRGVIFGSSPRSFEHLVAVARKGLLVVAFDHQAQDADQVVLDSVGVDNIAGARLAVEHLIRLGHRRIAFLSGPIRTSSRIDRLNGFRAAFHSAGLTPDDDLIWEGTAIGGSGDMEGVELGRIGMRHLLSHSHPPTAVFAINDMYALSAYTGAADLGLRIPDDVSIVGFDDVSMAAMAQPPLTTVRQPLRLMAQAVVTLLIGRLEGTHAEAPEHVVMVPELVTRASTAPPRMPGDVGPPLQRIAAGR